MHVLCLLLFCRHSEKDLHTIWTNSSTAMLQLVIISSFLLLSLFARLSSWIPEVDFYILFSLRPTYVAFLALFSLLLGIH